MKKYFSFNLYLEGIKRVRGAGVASAIVFGVLNLLPVLFFWVGYISSNFFGSTPKVKNVDNTLFMLFADIIILLAPVIVMRMFAFLNKRNASDFYHAIPQKRICLFLSFFAAAITWIAAIVLMSGVFCWIGWNLLPEYTASFAVMAKNVFSYTALGLLSACCMALAVTFTGNVFSNIFAYITIFGLPVLVANVFGAYIQTMQPTFVFEKSVFRFFGVKGFLPIAMGDAFYSPTSLAVILAYLVSALLIVASGFAFVRRKSETAENSTSSRLLQHVLRCCATLPVWLLLSWLAINSLGELSLLLVPIALTIYVVYELITTRRLINVAKSLPVFFVLPAFCALLLLGAFLCGLSVPLSNPNSTDEVSYIVFEDDVYAYPYNNLPYELLCGVKIDNPEVIRYATNDFKYKDKYGDADETVMLKLKNGRTLWRNVGISFTNRELLGNALLKDEKCKNILLTLPEYSDIKIDVKFSVWQSFVQEYNKLSDEQKISVYEADYYYDDLNMVLIQGTRKLNNGNNLYTEYKLDKMLFPETYKMYMDLYGKYE